MLPPSLYAAMHRFRPRPNTLTRCTLLLALLGAALPAPAQVPESDALLLQLVSGAPVREWPDRLNLPPSWTQAFADDIAVTTQDLRERARCLSLRGADPARVERSLRDLATVAAQRSDAPGALDDTAALRRTLAERFAGQPAAALWPAGARIEGGAVTVDAYGQLDTCTGTFVGLFHSHPLRIATKDAAVLSDIDFTSAMKERRPFISIVGDMAGGLCVLLKPEATRLEDIARSRLTHGEPVARAMDALLLQMLHGFGLAGMDGILDVEQPRRSGSPDRVTAALRRDTAVTARTADSLGAALYCGALGQPLARVVFSKAAVPRQNNPGAVALAKALSVVMAYIDRPQNPDIPFALTAPMDAGYKAYLKTLADTPRQGRPHRLREPMLAALASAQGPSADLLLAFEYERLYDGGYVKHRPLMSPSSLKTQDLRQVLSGRQAGLDTERDYLILLVADAEQRPVVEVHKVRREEHHHQQGSVSETTLVARIMPTTGHLRPGLDSAQTRIDAGGRSSVVAQDIATVPTQEPQR